MADVTLEEKIKRVIKEHKGEIKTEKDLTCFSTMMMKNLIETALEVRCCMNEQVIKAMVPLTVPRKIPAVLSFEEITQILNTTQSLKYKAALWGGVLKPPNSE